MKTSLIFSGPTVTPSVKTGMDLSVKSGSHCCRLSRLWYSITVSQITRLNCTLNANCHCKAFINTQNQVKVTSKFITMATFKTSNVQYWNFAARWKLMILMYFWLFDKPGHLVSWLETSRLLVHSAKSIVLWVTLNCLLLQGSSVSARWFMLKSKIHTDCYFIHIFLALGTANTATEGVHHGVIHTRDKTGNLSPQSISTHLFISKKWACPVKGQPKRL